VTGLLGLAIRAPERGGEARDVALRVLEIHPDEAILHFNLGCYLSLSGEFPAARKRLYRAIKLNKRFKAEFVEVEDLAGLWDWFESEE
jgi:Flp pilus assembly protein TadD